MHYGYSSPSGYSGNSLARYNNFVNACLGLTPDIMQVSNPIHDYSPAHRFLAIDMAILPRDTVRSDMKVLAQTPQLSMVRYPDASPRVYLAANPRPSGGGQDALSYVMNTATDLIQSPAVESRSPVPPGASLAAGENVKIVDFRSTRVELEVQAAQPRVVVLAEMFENNWTATVNDRPAEIFPANYLFRGVEVPAGPSRVVFAYRPASFRRGAAISIFALGGVVLLGWRKRRKRT
jgi:hypothetical protein